MSFFDDMRALSADLFTGSDFELPVATLARKTTVRTDADRDAGKKGTVSTQTITGSGVLGTRKLKLADGTIRQEAIATLNIVPVKGDFLTIGARTLEVIAVEETNPDGGATAFKFVAVLQ